MPATYFDSAGVHKDTHTKQLVNSGLRLSDAQLAQRKQGVMFYAKYRNGQWELKSAKSNRSGRKKGSLGKRKIKVAKSSKSSSSSSSSSSKKKSKKPKLNLSGLDTGSSVAAALDL